MPKSIPAFALALALTAGLAATSHAAEQTPTQLAAALPQSSVSALMPTPLSDSESGINPAVNIGTTGIYDQGDRYAGPQGFPLSGTVGEGEGN